MLFCCAWVIQIASALFHEPLVEVVISVIGRHIFFYHRGQRSFFRIIFDKVIPMNSFGNCRVVIVFDLICSVRDARGNGKGPKSSLLKFLAACKILFVIFIEYFLPYLEVVSQLEAIAMSV